MSDFTELASVDGKITATAEATIGLKDDGLYRGDGAFEVVRLYGGRPFAMADHVVDRLGPRRGPHRARAHGEVLPLLDGPAGVLAGQARPLPRNRRPLAAWRGPPLSHTSHSCCLCRGTDK